MAIPVRFGKYEIIRRLGKSMTEVYLARDEAANRKVALKVMPLAGDRHAALVVEAERRGAAIQKDLHDVDPRVVEIYEYGEIDGYFFVAMQYVEGRTIAEVLAAERVVDPCRAAVIALELCEQLAKFHGCESAVVHGDIKPSNIHLGHSDTVRLLDFGIARLLRVDADATAHDFGSPGYCSPERLSRAEVDPHSDLWALGATLYEMLSGVPPYQAEDTGKLESLIRSRRPPRALPPSCPVGLRAIVTKSLAPDPAKRYWSAPEFQADLQLFLEGKPTLAELQNRPRWNPTATLEAARQALRKITRTAARRRARRLQAAGAAAYFTTGMVLWIGGSFAWQAWQARASAAPAPIAAPAPKPDLSQGYRDCGREVVDGYRTSANPGLYEHDWPKAEVCLQRAVQLGDTSDATSAQLAMVRGFGTLERLNSGQYSDAGAALLRAHVRDEFVLASGKAPTDPLPHLALARVYVYSLRDPERAMAEFAAAEKLGAKLGRREVEQQGDAYRLRAQREYLRDWGQAARDAETARGFYRKIADFDEAGMHLRELDRIRPPAATKTRRSR